MDLAGRTSWAGVAIMSSAFVLHRWGWKKLRWTAFMDATKIDGSDMDGI